MIYFTSDLHLNHDKSFLYEPRGFTNVADMNQAIVNEWNSQATEEDDIYVLGDLMLGDNDSGMKYLKQLKGKIHIILGNHDTARRIELYKTLPNLVGPVSYAEMIIYKQGSKKLHFMATHWPMHTSNEGDGHMSETIINLFGHTHQQSNFYNEDPFMYHVGCDSHACKLVSIEQIIEDIRTQKQKYENNKGDN